jgi:hypothetical protein
MDEEDELFDALEEDALEEDGEDAAGDPMLEDPRTTEDPQGLVNGLDHTVRDIEWRIIARDRQAYVLKQSAELEKSATDILAQWEDAARPQPVPQSPEEAKALIGRMLQKCEGGIAAILTAKQDGAPRIGEYGKASQLMHAAVKLMQVMGEVDRRAAPDGDRG